MGNQDYFCWAKMAGVYLTLRHVENAEKCWQNFFSAKREDAHFDGEDSHLKFVCACENYITQALALGAPVNYIGVMKNISDDIYNELLARASECGDPSLSIRAYEAAKWVDLNLRTHKSLNLRANEEYVEEVRVALELPANVTIAAWPSEGGASNAVWRGAKVHSLGVGRGQLVTPSAHKPEVEPPRKRRWWKSRPDKG